MATVFGIVGWYAGCMVSGRTASGGFRKASFMGRFVWGTAAIGICYAAGGPAGLIAVLTLVDLASGAHLWAVRSENEKQRQQFKASLEPETEQGGAMEQAMRLVRNKQREEKEKARIKAAGGGGKQGHFASVYVHPMVGVPVAVLLLVRPKVAVQYAGQFAAQLLGGGPGATGVGSVPGSRWGAGSGGDPEWLAPGVGSGGVTSEDGGLTALGEGESWEVWARLSAVQMLLFSFAMMNVRSLDFFASLLMRGMVLAGCLVAVLLGASPGVLLLYAAPHLVSLPLSLAELGAAGWSGWQSGGQSKVKAS